MDILSSYSQPPQSPLDGSAPNLAPETPELYQVFRKAMRSVMGQISVCMPASVVAVTAEQTVDIQLLPQTLYKTATAVTDRPIVSATPVIMPMGATWSIRLPVAVGDLGLALFADRSIDNYLAGDGSAPYDPEDSRMHALSDAMFLPGLATTRQQTTGNDSDMVLTNGQSQVKIKANGTLQITNGQNELLDLLDQLLTVLTTEFFTPTLAGPSPPLASTVQALKTVQSALGTLKA